MMMMMKLSFPWCWLAVSNNIEGDRAENLASLLWRTVNLVYVQKDNCVGGVDAAVLNNRFCVATLSRHYSSTTRSRYFNKNINNKIKITDRRGWFPYVRIYLFSLYLIKQLFQDSSFRILDMFESSMYKHPPLSLCSLVRLVCIDRLHPSRLSRYIIIYLFTIFTYK